MSAAERAAVDQAMREAPVDLGGDPDEQRPLLLAMLGAVPPPADVVSTVNRIGGVGVVEVDVRPTDETGASSLCTVVPTRSVTRRPRSGWRASSSAAPVHPR